MSELWMFFMVHVVPVLLLIGVFTGQAAICRKWGRCGYVLPGILSLPVIYCVYSLVQTVIDCCQAADYHIGLGLLAAGFWFILSLGTGALLATSLAATVAGMRMRKREQEAAEWGAVETEMESE